MHSIIAFFKKWWFGLVLGVAYLAIFNLWQIVSREWIIFSSVAVSSGLCALLVTAARRQYFLNTWDTLFHAAVILDILLEGTLIREHQSRGFYLCALGFAIVIGCYRFYLRRS